METALLKTDTEVSRANVAEEASNDAVRELSSLELALVGGGAASNSFI